ncbi:MAG: N-acetylmuramoyl-L-alanine amidase [Elusimicrobiaceae bacterium]|nr:N-acetylmuramoyl-L-alanine amidase [Elusimicrobiaceae bacterium]
MKKIVFCIFCFLALSLAAQDNPLPVAPYLPAQSGDDAPITVQHPQENYLISRGANNIYIFGKLNLENPTLDINGQVVPVYKNGTFIAYVPVEQGSFALVLTAKSQGKTYQAVRNVRIPGTPLKQLTGKARFDEKEVYPSKPVWVVPGDTLELSVRGTPHARVTAEINGLKGGKKITLKESSRTPGRYQTKYVIRDKEKPRSAKITYKMVDPATHTHAKITAKQRVKILDITDPLYTARIKEEGTKVRQLPVHQGSLYPFYRAFGQVQIDGRNNGLYRLHLGNGESAWIEEKKVAVGSAHTLPVNIISDISTVATTERTQVRWEGMHPVPVSVHEFNNRMEITFYYSDQLEENFNFDATSPLLDRIEWKGSKNGVLPFVLYFKKGTTPWGHGYHYNGSQFVLDLYHAPEHTPTDQKPLAEVRVLLDAGHSPKRVPPYDGLVSPSGFLEYEANLALAEVLKPKLEAAGATVIMTRQADNHISLPQRYQKAMDEKAHIFVSLHHNALPDTANPMAYPRGYSIYYTYPHSFQLANSVYQSFNKHIPLADNGLIANNVLFIPRISEMPSILIENAFMILPEQEELVMSPQGREMFAQAIYEGILQFYAPSAPATPVKGKKKPRKTKK